MINIFNRTKSDINSIIIPDFGWDRQKEDKSIIQWINSKQTIALSINYFDTKPDLPSIKNVDIVRDFYREQVSQANGGLIEVDFSETISYKTI